MGSNLANVTQGSDYSPYLQLEHMDPKWIAAMQGEGAEHEAQESIGERASKRRRKDSKIE